MGEMGKDGLRTRRPGHRVIEEQAGRKRAQDPLATDAGLGPTSPSPTVRLERRAERPLLTGLRSRRVRRLTLQSRHVGIWSRVRTYGWLRVTPLIHSGTTPLPTRKPTSPPLPWSYSVSGWRSGYVLVSFPLRWDLPTVRKGRLDQSEGDLRASRAGRWGGVEK